AGEASELCARERELLDRAGGGGSGTVAVGCLAVAARLLARRPGRGRRTRSARRAALEGRLSLAPARVLSRDPRTRRGPVPRRRGAVDRGGGRAPRAGGRAPPRRGRRGATGAAGGLAHAARAGTRATRAGTRRRGGGRAAEAGARARLRGARRTRRARPRARGATARVVRGAASARGDTGARV